MKSIIFGLLAGKQYLERFGKETCGLYLNTIRVKDDDVEVVVMTREQFDRLRGALDDAAGAVTSEYCSHRGECGATTPGCYAQDFYKVLDEVKFPSHPNR